MKRSARNRPVARESVVLGWAHRRDLDWVRRLVVNQVRGACMREDVFAATPPLAAKRFMLSRAASRGNGHCLGLWDVSVAFFHPTIEEEVFVRPPKNLRKDKTTWKLLKATYGTQVASSRWQR